MGLKSFQIKMDTAAHRQLKTRSGQLGLTIGDMIQNLLSAFECRLSNLRDGLIIDTPTDSVSIDSKLMELLFKLDVGELNNKALKAELAKLSASLVEEGWKPEIKLNEDMPKEK